MERHVEIVNDSGGGDAGGRARESRAGSHVAKVAAETIGGSRGRAAGVIATPQTQTTQRIGSGAGESGVAVEGMDTQAASRGDAGVGAHDPQLVRHAASDDDIIRQQTPPSDVGPIAIP